MPMFLLPHILSERRSTAVVPYEGGGLNKFVVTAGLTMYYQSEKALGSGYMASDCGTPAEVGKGKGGELKGKGYFGDGQKGEGNHSVPKGLAIQTLDIIVAPKVVAKANDTEENAGVVGQFVTKVMSVKCECKKWQRGRRQVAFPW